MTILADLASRIPSLRNETTGTEALGLILRNPVAASALTAAVRSGAAHLPDPLSFATEVRDSDGRPDLVGRDGVREVLLIEGKLWAGFTAAQSQGHYLRRLLKQHATTAKDHPHRGALLLVVPGSTRPSPPTPRCCLARILDWVRSSPSLRSSTSDTVPSTSWLSTPAADW